MKNIVVNDEYVQADIKPLLFLEEYMALLHKDMISLVGQNSLKSVACPGCDSTHSKRFFERFGLQYCECLDCASVYANPRPSDSQIGLFFKEATAKTFWRNQLSEASQHKRKDKIIKPRLEWVLDSVAEHAPGAKHWVDIHPSQHRYLDAMAQSSIAQKTVVYPYGNFNIPSSIKVIHQPWWSLPADFSCDVVTLFEVMDHASDVNQLFNVLHQIVSPGGLCFLTAILSSGFDVKELGSNAPNIVPPDRLNVLSVKGLKQVIEKHGFECLEFSTPGVLDLDIVTQAVNKNPSLPISNFVRSLIASEDEEVKRMFGEFLQRSLLSSYGRVLFRKV